MIKLLKRNHLKLLAMIAASVFAGAMATAQDKAPSNTVFPIVELELGNPDAPVTVIEYASFACPNCASFQRNIWPELKANYVDTGKIRFIFRPVYFNGPGLWADLVARCGGPEKYFELTDLLFSEQESWAFALSQTEVAAGLLAVGRMAGLEDAQTQTCMEDTENARQLIFAFQENINRDLIELTPSFLINGVLKSDLSYAEFAQLLEIELAK